MSPDSFPLFMWEFGSARLLTLPVGETTDRIHSQDDSFQRMRSGIILNARSVMSLPVWPQASIPCPWPAAIEHNYYIPSRHGKLDRVSQHIFLSLSLLLPEIKIRLARETIDNIQYNIIIYGETNSLPPSLCLRACRATIEDSYKMFILAS